MVYRSVRSGTGGGFAVSPRLLFRYRADIGLADMARGPFGPLSTVGGAVAMTTDADGNAQWDLRAASGGNLKALGTVVMNTPIHVFLIAQAGPAPAATQVWLNAGQSGGSTFVIYLNTTNVTLTGSATVNIPCTPANENFFNFYCHDGATRTSLQGAAYVARAVGTNCGIMTGIALGANGGGTQRADVRIAEVLGFQGQITDSDLASLTDYVRTRYPSIGVAVSPPASFSIDQVSLGPVPGTFDFFPWFGQSNFSCFATTATATAAASTFVFAKDNTFKAMPQLYDSSTNIFDTVATNGLAGKVGGPGTSFANTYQAASGRACVIVPCPLQGSFFNGVPGANFDQWWSPLAVGGFKLRNSLYGSLLARCRNMLALGGTFRAAVFEQGESECIFGGAAAANWASTAAFILNSFFSDFGQPQRVAYQQTFSTVSTAAPADIATVQAQQASLASANRLMNPAFAGGLEADNIHWNAASCDTVGAQVANLIIAKGAPWI